MNVTQCLLSKRFGNCNMLKRCDFNYRRKADILTQEGSFVVAKSPIIIASTKVDILKTAASFHGSIARDASGNADLVAEMQRHPDALWIRVKAIEADAPNDNGDYFSREEIVKSYRTFEGVPVFTNHENNKVENAKGKVVKAEWDDREGAVYCTMFIDRKANPHLCRAIEEGYVTDVSMGTQVDFSTCSVCEKKAFTADDYCDHVKTMKGRNVEGKKVFEKNYGLKFIEISVVTDGACKDCTIREVIEPAEFLQRIAAAVKTVRLLKTNAVEAEVATAGMVKDGGQVEIQKLNQAMDLLEDVCRAMLDQRQYIDLEFLNKVAEVLADLQHVNDELVDQGYGRVGDPSAMQQQQMGIPPLPENSGGKQEQGMEGPKPFLSGPSQMGVGSVTEPATAASSGSKTVLSARIKDLHDTVTKIYEEQRVSRGGNTAVDINAKANETRAKLATIWKNPSVKNFRTEISEGDLKIVVGEEEIVGLYGGKKVAALKIANLDPDVKEWLKNDPRGCGDHLIDSLKNTFAGKMEKAAEYTANVSEKDQHEMTMEAQLRTQKPDLHPRTNEVRESITEDQLKKGMEGYEYHKRTSEARDSITEKQLSEGRTGYDQFERQDQPGVRDEIMELQLRNDKWKGNVTPAGADGWANGVPDQHQAITEKQLEGWKSADKRFLPTDRITEKQLAEDSENWGRRIASKDDAKKAYAATLKAIAATSKATGATPDELVEAISEMVGDPHNTIAATKAVETLKLAKDMRVAMLRRAKFHGSPKTASKGEVCDCLLGMIGDAGMSGEVGMKVLAGLVAQKDSYSRVNDAIVAGAAEDDPFGTAFSSTTDFLKEVIAETDEKVKREEVTILLPKTAIKVDEKDTEKFAEAAYAAAISQAEKAGIKVTDKVHIAKRDDGKIEVALHGVKMPKVAATAAPVTEAAKTDLAARKDARQKVAQMGGGMPDMGGGAGAAPGAGPGMGGGGTTMPGPAGAPGADPTAGVPPVAGMGDTAAGDEEAEGGEGEALPPGSICPVCGSDNVDIRHGEFTCNGCGAAGEFSVKIKITEYPGVIEDTEPHDKGEGDMGVEEGGIGDMGGGGGMEMPPVGMAAAFRVTPEMVKIAGSKPIGSFCPHCGSNKTKIAASKGCASCSCESCGNCFKVDTYIDATNKELYARVEWNDMQVIKLAKKEAAKRKEAAAASKALGQKRAALENALKTKGLTAKFAKADAAGKATIIAELANKGMLPR